MHLTDKDKQLLALMQRNAREPVASLARRLGVSRTALKERIQKLEHTGIIEGYSVRLSKGVSQATVQCYTFAVLDNKTYADVSRHLKALPSVQSVHAISGDFELIVHVVAETLEKLNGELNKLNEIPGIVRTNSHIVMETKFDRLREQTAKA